MVQQMGHQVVYQMVHQMVHQMVLKILKKMLKNTQDTSIDLFNIINKEDNIIVDWNDLDLAFAMFNEYFKNINLDEILKGTNSKDKEEGSAKFLQKLNQLEARGIIATHDLSLTNLANVYTSVVNKYFDTEINGDDISFDYCIRNGVAKNMNASFLLRKMGLIDS
jgi:hypothetical protein